MTEFQYVREHGDYVLYDMGVEPSRLTGRREPLSHCHELALAFDRESGTLHKHGDRSRVEAWTAQARAKFVQGGFPEMADDLVVLSGDLPLEEVNKCLAITGYCKRMLEKLQAQLPQTPCEGACHG